MRKRTMRSVRITVLVFILASAVGAFRRPHAPVQGAQARPREGPQAKEALQKVCSSCHALDKVVSLGAKGTEEEFAAIFAYLVRRYGRVNVNAATAGEIAEVVGLSEQEADVIVKYRQEKGKFDDFEALSKAPGVAVEKLEKSREAISY